jgi:curli biogenesis system outer membrane secretion channel CsgG
MKRQHLLLLVVILVVACAPRTGKWQKVVEVKTTSNEFRVQKLGILPFRCSDSSVGDLVADSVAAHLLDGDFIVIERTYLSAIVQEQGLSLTGLTKTTDYSKIGHLADVDFLVVGSVGVLELTSTGGWGGLWGGFFKASSFSYINNASARVVDVSTGQVVISCLYTLPGGAGNDDWLDPNVVGEALAGAIQDTLEKKN